MNSESVLDSLTQAQPAQLIFSQQRERDWRPKQGAIPVETRKVQFWAGTRRILLSLSIFPWISIFQSSEIMIIFTWRNKKNAREKLMAKEEIQPEEEFRTPNLIAMKCNNKKKENEI